MTVLLATVLAACGGGTSRGAAVATADEQALDNAVEQARSIIKEAYATLRRGKVGGLQPLVAETLFAVGPGPEHVYSGRAQALDALSRLVDFGAKHRLRSRRLVAVSSPSGKSAWVAGQLVVGRTQLRLTAVLAEVDELWAIVALELSVPVSDSEAEKLSAGKDQARAVPIPGGVDNGASEVAELFRQAAAMPETFSEQLSERRDVVAIGGSAREFKRGPRSIRRAWKKALEASPTMALTGGIRASVTPDGALAWVAADVDASHKGTEPTPHRAFAIYERTAEGWRLVAMHEAVITSGS